MKLEVARKHFSYDPATGVLSWAFYQPRRPKNLKCGYRHHTGYFMINFYQKKYLAHRIIWLLVNGVWVERPFMLGHIDGNGFNNKLENLRVVTHSENMQNNPLSRSGRPVGVIRQRKTGKWIARRPKNYLGKSYGKAKHLGVHDTIQGAAEAMRASVKQGEKP